MEAIPTRSGLVMFGHPLSTKGIVPSTFTLVQSVFVWSNEPLSNPGR